MPFLSEQRVEAEWKDTQWVICGEGPAREELAQGKGFVGPSGKMLWPFVWRLGQLNRDIVSVTNLSKRPLSNEDGEEKLTDEEFAECQKELAEELKVHRRGRITDPLRILAVGALAAKALLDDQLTTMDACSGVTFETEFGLVTPCFHPAAALGGGGKDVLAWIAGAIEVWTGKKIASSPFAALHPLLAVDTEGTPDDPICLSWACRNADNTLASGVVYAEDVPNWWAVHTQAYPYVVWHNALWDWSVMEAMGVPEPWTVPYRDTMEIAYLLHTEPQGLKALAWRHFKARMKSWEDVVMPHYEEVIRNMALGFISAGTAEITHSPKTGKPYKKPRYTYTEETKKLRRLRSVESMAEAMGGITPSLRFVPRAEMEEYAKRDAEMTLMLAEKWA